MTRPESHADLSEYQRQGHALFSWQSPLDKFPEVQVHLVAAKVAAKKLGMQLTEFEVRNPLTKDELDDKLSTDQDKWDRGTRVYAEILTGYSEFGALTWTDKNAATYYAEREGLEHPSKINEEASA
jgi:hypothetical protein